MYFPDALRVTYNTVFGSPTDRDDAPNRVVLVTDGESTQEELATVPEAREAKSRGNEIFTLGIGNKTNMEELLGVASSPSYWFLHLFRDLDDLLDSADLVLSNLCSGRPPTVKLNLISLSC